MMVQVMRQMIQLQVLKTKKYMYMMVQELIFPVLVAALRRLAITYGMKQISYIRFLIEKTRTLLGMNAR